VDWIKPLQDTPHLSFHLERKEKHMIKRVHGIDRHKKYSTICVMNMEGAIKKMINACLDLGFYISGLNEEDAVILEAANGSFYWADKIEEQGASVFIVDTRKFKIIKDSWKKTDKQDAKNLAWALWVNLKSPTHGLPLVDKPDHRIRELRRLFAQYQLVNQQTTKLKPVIQASLSDVGFVLNSTGKKTLFHKMYGKEMLKKLSCTPAVLINISLNLDMLWVAEDCKEKLKEEIIRFGAYLKEDVELLMSIRGINFLGALAFLTDVGDISRFENRKKLNAYLGVVPTAHSSGGKSKNGHITKASRHLTRWILSEAMPHITKSSPIIQRYYEELQARRGTGRARIAVLRRMIGIMRRILLNREKYNHYDELMHITKLRNYWRKVEKIREVS
jgi:transposase